MRAEERQVSMSYFVPTELENLKSAAGAATLTKADVKSQVGKNGIKFVAAKNYPIGSKPVSLFMVTDKPADLVKIVRKHKSAQVSTGICNVGKNGSVIQVSIVQSTGQIAAADIAKLVKVALGNDAGYIGKVPARGPAETPAA
jgi:hypothetical protein